MDPRPTDAFRQTLVSSLAVLASIAAVLILVTARQVFFLGFLAILLAILLDIPVSYFSSKMRRSMAVLLVLFILLVGLGALGAITLPIMSNQFEQLVAKIPTALERLRAWFSQASAGTAPGKFSEAITLVLSQTLPAALGTATVITAAIFVLVLAAFLVADPNGYQRTLRAIIPADFAPVFDRIWSDLRLRLHGWLLGILISMTLMGSMTALGLRIVGIENWAILGFITFLGTFVPYVGGILSAIPGLLLGIAQSPRDLIYVAIVYLLVHLVEGYLIEPLVMHRAVSLRPAALLFWLLLLGTLAGPLAIAVATPLLVCLNTALHALRKDGPSAGEYLR